MAESPAPPADPPSAYRPVVLVVEDDDALREITETLVRSFGYEALSAASSGEAVELFQRRGGEIDLLLADVVMPDLDGPRLARLLRERRPQLAVLFVSGYPDALAVRGLPNEELLLKPFTSAVLAARLRRLLPVPGAPR